MTQILGRSERLNKVQYKIQSQRASKKKKKKVDNQRKLPLKRCLDSIPGRVSFESVLSSVHGILQARILERVAVPFSKGSSQPRDQTQISPTEGRFFTIYNTREAQDVYIVI